MTEPLTLSLTKPIEANGATIASLIFREPTGGDLAECGMPVSFELIGSEPQMAIDPKAMTAVLARLASVPPSSIRLLTAGDWTAAAYMVAPFFLPAVSSSTSSS